MNKHALTRVSLFSEFCWTADSSLQIKELKALAVINQSDITAWQQSEEST